MRQKNETTYVALTPAEIKEWEKVTGIPESMPFSEWLENCRDLFTAKQLHRGRVVRQSDFADWLSDGDPTKLSQNALSQYITGKRRPNPEQADVLAGKLGYEVYDRLNIPRRMPKNRAIYELVDGFPDLDLDEQKELLEHLHNIQTRHNERKTRANTKQNETA